MGPGHWATLRPKARECLAALRGMGRVRLLTSASFSYAMSASDVFYLGFQRTDIVGHELWTSFLGPLPSLNRGGDILIDDDQSTAIPAKCLFIGIVLERVVLVPAYVGVADKALDAVPALVERVLRS